MFHLTFCVLPYENFIFIFIPSNFLLVIRLLVKSIYSDSLTHAPQEQLLHNPNFLLQLPPLRNKLIKLSLITKHQPNGKPTELMNGLLPTYLNSFFILVGQWRADDVGFELLLKK